MLGAVHKKTFEGTGSLAKSGFYAWQIWDFFGDPHEEGWICCPVCKKPVTPVRSHVRAVRSGKEVTVVSHFRLREGVGGCVSREGAEHKMAKLLLATLVENKEVTLKIGNSTIPYSQLRFKEVPTLPFRWEQSREKRRADVLFELQEWHNVLGQGIVFEIQTSELSKPEKEQRERDWISSGYSLAWIDKSQFTDDYSLASNEITVDFPWSLSFVNLLRKSIVDMRKLVTKYSWLMRQYWDRSIKTCRTCIHGSPSTRIEGVIACWYGTIWGKGESKGNKRHPSNHEPLDTCPFWSSGEG